MIEVINSAAESYDAVPGAVGVLSLTSLKYPATNLKQASKLCRHP